MAGWVGLNSLAWMFSAITLIDPPPFTGLTCVTSVLAFYLVILILASERRANLLAERREQLTLELAILGEQKTAKVIQLLEEIRHDAPGLKGRADPEAADMARPADPSAVIAAIDASHSKALGLERRVKDRRGTGLGPAASKIISTVRQTN